MWLMEDEIKRNIEFRYSEFIGGTNMIQSTAVISKTPTPARNTHRQKLTQHHGILDDIWLVNVIYVHNQYICHKH